MNIFGKAVILNRSFRVQVSVTANNIKERDL